MLHEDFVPSSGRNLHFAIPHPCRTKADGRLEVHVGYPINGTPPRVSSLGTRYRTRCWWTILETCVTVAPARGPRQRTAGGACARAHQRTFLQAPRSRRRQMSLTIPSPGRALRAFVQPHAAVDDLLALCRGIGPSSSTSSTKPSRVCSMVSSTRLRGCRRCPAGFPAARACLRDHAARQPAGACQRSSRSEAVNHRQGVEQRRQFGIAIEMGTGQHIHRQPCATSSRLTRCWICSSCSSRLARNSGWAASSSRCTRLPSTASGVFSA